MFRSHRADVPGCCCGVDEASAETTTCCGGGFCGCGGSFGCYGVAICCWCDCKFKGRAGVAACCACAVGYDFVDLAFASEVAEAEDGVRRV